MVSLYLFVLLAWTRVQAISTAWRPAYAAPASSGPHHDGPIYATGPGQFLYDLDASSFLGQRDRCALYKVSMNQQLYFEYIQYKIDLPSMKEFTLCAWTKFNNHTNDHPIFSYAVGDQPRGILSWVANTARSSYYMMNIDGHNLYRLNYPLRLNKWYHSCQSWNGRTGEWQIWVNDERVGRGFNNRLVGHVIKGGGIAITGQEQRQLGGGFLEGDGAPKGAGGYLGEVTMLQLYSVALTAGKAHKDHKHHHAHHYEHDTSNNTPRPMPRPPATPPPPHPFLTGGQINTQVKLNPGTPLQIVQGGVTLRHPSLVPRNPPPQPLPPVNPESISSAFPLQSSQFFGSLQPAAGLHSTNGLTDAGASFADGPYRNLFKREKDSSRDESTGGELDASLEVPTKKRETQEATVGERSDGKVTFVSETNSESSESDKKLEKRDSDKKKRGLVQLGDGLIVDDGYISQGLDNEYFSGLTNFGLQLPKYENKDDEREPAEAEVRMIMDICDGCAEDPFAKVLIMAWRSVPKKLYSGALHLPAKQACKAF
ncbi:pentraxin-related protein b6 [Colletes latitarsis]|uniref:pentraxin-related protein b6 n=1 Tax=Colletes latitarsis TaxID=2605962 RepID=UPI0040365D82